MDTLTLNELLTCPRVIQRFTHSPSQQQKKRTFSLAVTKEAHILPRSNRRFTHSPSQQQKIHTFFFAATKKNAHFHSQQQKKRTFSLAVTEDSHILPHDKQRINNSPSRQTKNHTFQLALTKNHKFSSEALKANANT